ncbi:MAG: 4a-hydroxytetrahydrobiopterin dehydratase [Kordiimonadaceae bacterium]|nr:4a-hydroxytetrahydrobiopterin dehydratase [Kordiimonadaceae bacterium]
MTIRPKLLTEAEREEALTSLTGWIYQPEKQLLHKKFMFKTFKEAWAFMSQSALMAEKLDHHPDWSNSYNSVTVGLTTHDVGGVTQLDVSLASAMNAFFKERE